MLSETLEDDDGWPPDEGDDRPRGPAALLGGVSGRLTEHGRTSCIGFHLKFDILTNDKLEASATGNWFRDSMAMANGAVLRMIDESILTPAVIEEAIEQFKIVPRASPL